MKGFRQFIKGILIRGETSDPSDNLEGSIFVNSTSNRLKVYLQSAIRTLVSENQAQTLSNKTLDNTNSATLSDSNLTIQDNGDATKQMRFEASGISSGQTRVFTVPDSNTTLVGSDATQTLTNKTIDGDDNTVQDLALTSIKTNLSDANKFIVRDASGIPVSNTKDVPTGNVVGTSDSQTLTNKTIDGDDNTVQDLALGSLKTVLGDANNFVVRNGSGVVISNTKAVPTGNVVGTSDTQTLSNKTLDNTTILTVQDNNLLIQDNADNTKQLNLQLSGISSGATRTLTVPNANTTIVGTDVAQVITNKDIDGGTASNSNRITIPKDTKTNLDALTRKEATIVYASDEDKFYGDDGTTLFQIGSGTGSGGKNYITNGDAENGISIGTGYDDGASSRPTNGTGGTATGVTFTRSTTNPLSGTASWELAKDNNDRQGKGYSFEFTIDREDETNVLEIELRYVISSGTYNGGSPTTDSDIIAYIYDIDNSVLIEPAGFKIGGSSQGVQYSYKGVFQTAKATFGADARKYRLILHTATTSTAAFTLRMEMSVNPVQSSIGFAGSDVISYTPTVSPISGYTLSPLGFYKRLGDILEGVIVFQKNGSTGTGGGTLTFSLPSGLSIDTNKTNNNSGTINYGEAEIFGSTFTALAPVTHSGSATTVAIGKVGASAALVGTDVAASSYFNLKFRVPILGWGSSVITSASTDQRVVACRLFQNSAQSVGSGATATVNLDSITHDTHGMANLASDRIDIKVPGYYLINGCVALDSGANTGRIVGFIRKNGTTILVENLAAGNNQGGDSSPVFTTAFLNSGDYLELRIVNDTGGTFNTAAATSDVFLEVVRVAGPDQIQASDFVGARYNQSSGQSISNNTLTIVDYSTKSYDATGSVTTGASWKFTAPISGIYKINSKTVFGTGSMNAGTRLFMDLYKNGSQFSRLNDYEVEVTAASFRELAGEDSIPLLAGDFIDIRINQDNGTTEALASDSAQNFITINRIGNYV